MRQNIKAMRVSDFPEEAWVIMGEARGAADKSIEELYEAVDYLYRGVTIRAQKLASVPFVVQRGKRVIYDSEGNKPPPKGFEWLEDLPVMLEMVEAAVCLGGRAYIRPNKNNYNMVGGLQWLVPTSIKPIFDEVGQINYFERTIAGTPEKIAAEELIYFWPPDATRETGPAKRFPGKAAMKAAGVLANMDKFLESYFDRGAIKVTLLTTEGVVTKESRALLKEWWAKVTGGISKAFGAEVINAGKVTPVVIGEGIKDLENTALTAEKREAICAALGVPPSKVIPSAANFATKQSDDVMLVSDTVVPQLRWIGRSLNKQLFSPLGLAIVFQPESLPEMQADENERAQSLVHLTSAGMPLLLACEVLGYDIPEEWLAKLQEIEQQKDEMREAGAQALAGAAAGKKPEEKEEEQGETSGRPPIEKSWLLAKQLDEAQRFERWLKNDKDRDPADFVSDILSDDEKLRIKAIIDGKLIPEGSPAGYQYVDSLELSSPADLDRLIARVERWAKDEGLDLDKMLEATVDND